MQTVCKVNIGENHEVVLSDDETGMIVHVNAVDIGSDGLDIHAGGKFAVVILKGGCKGDDVAVKDGAAVCRYLLIAVVIINGGDGGIYGVLIVIAVDKFDVIDVNAACRHAFGISGKALCDKADGVVAEHHKGAVALTLEACTYVDPALTSHIRKGSGGYAFTVFIGVSITVCEIYRFACGTDDTLHGVAGRSFGNIYPHAETGR